VAIAAGQRQKGWLEAIGKRVGITAEMLGTMKGVKMSGLVDRLSEVIKILREEEIQASQKYRIMLIAVVTLGKAIMRNLKFCLRKSKLTQFVQPILTLL
jgi:ATP-binding cassette subfamily C (CFTR/MRP) protein 1